MIGEWMSGRSRCDTEELRGGIYILATTFKFRDSRMN